MAALLWGLLWPFWKVLLNLVASLVAVMIWLCKQLLSWLLWVLWPILLLLVFVGWFAISAKSCEAGWFDWLWGNDNSDARAAEQFQRAAELASESTRIAGEVAAAQVRQANEQARQNSQVAEMLKELSSERRDYARQLEELSAIALRDSEWAAALSALEPGLICLTVLLIAGLVLALALKNSPGNEAGDGGARGDALLAIDVLVEEISRAPIRPYQAGGAVGAVGAGGDIGDVGGHLGIAAPREIPAPGSSQVQLLPSAAPSPGGGERYALPGPAQPRG